VSLFGNSCQRRLSAPEAASQEMLTRTPVRDRYGAEGFKRSCLRQQKIARVARPLQRQYPSRVGAPTGALTDGLVRQSLLRSSSFLPLRL
jgi:hypothetical protein